MTLIFFAPASAQMQAQKVRFNGLLQLSDGDGSQMMSRYFDLLRLHLSIVREDRVKMKRSSEDKADTEVEGLIVECLRQW